MSEPTYIVVKAEVVLKFNIGRPPWCGIWVYPFTTPKTSGGAFHLRPFHLPRALHVAFAHVADGAGEESARTAGGVQQTLAWPRIDAVQHEGCDRIDPFSIRRRRCQHSADR